MHRPESSHLVFVPGEILGGQHGFDASWGEPPLLEIFPERSDFWMPEAQILGDALAVDVTPEQPMEGTIGYVVDGSVIAQWVVQLRIGYHRPQRDARLEVYFRTHEYIPFAVERRSQAVLYYVDAQAGMEGVGAVGVSSAIGSVIGPAPIPLYVFSQKENASPSLIREIKNATKRKRKIRQCG